MPYVDRKDGRIVGVYNVQQHEGQEYVEGEVQMERHFNRLSAMQRLRDRRSPILNALAGIGFDALAAGDAATADAVKQARLGLRDITAWPAVVAAQDDESFDRAALARYRELAAAAPPAVRVAFLSAT